MSFASTELALSHAELLSCLLAEGTETTFFVVGAPGIGKSSILRQLPDYTPVMVDCAQFEPGDLMLPVVSEDKTTVRYALHDILQMNSGRPIALCLDELAKAAPSVQASLLPLIYERRLGSTRVPDGSIVFGTSNEDDDGVGDALHAHAWNRLCPVVLRAPTPEEWITWAAPAGVAPEIVAFARAYPAMFEHYSSPGSESNPYIFNPKTGRTRSYVSPRSLARCTPTVRARHAGTITVNAAQATLSGKIGSAAAAELSAYLDTGAQLPSTELILTDPDQARAVMTRLSTSATFILAVSLAQSAKADSAVPFVTFMDTLNEEATALFFTLVMKNTPAFSAITHAGLDITRRIASLRTLRF